MAVLSSVMTAPALPQVLCIDPCAASAVLASLASHGVAIFVVRLTAPIAMFVFR